MGILKRQRPVRSVSELKRYIDTHHGQVPGVYTIPVVERDEDLEVVAETDERYRGVFTAVAVPESNDSVLVFRSEGDHQHPIGMTIEPEDIARGAVSVLSRQRIDA